jgi:hypothetical protein
MKKLIRPLSGCAKPRCRAEPAGQVAVAVLAVKSLPFGEPFRGRERCAAAPGAVGLAGDRAGPPGR